MSEPRRPVGRYDERRSLSRGTRVGGAAVLVVALVAATFWAYQRFSGGQVQFGTRGYEVVSDTEVDVRFEVQKGVLESVRCSLTARDRDSVVVGTRDVVVGPSDREAVITRSSVTTTHRATTAEAVRCERVTP